MIKLTISVGNLEETIEGFKLNIGKFEKELDLITTETADQLVKLSKMDAPVDTGRLQREITKKKIKGGWNVTSEDTEYAGYPHWGTRYQRPQPYMIGKNSQIVFNSFSIKANRLLKKNWG